MEAAGQLCPQPLPKCTGTSEFLNGTCPSLSLPSLSLCLALAVVAVTIIDFFIKTTECFSLFIASSHISISLAENCSYLAEMCYSTGLSACVCACVHVLKRERALNSRREKEEIGDDNIWPLI